MRQACVARRGMGKITYMRRVTGIGGIIFKANDPEKLGAWYAKHLDFPVEAWGGASFKWRELDAPNREAHTVWSLFDKETKSFEPSENHNNQRTTGWRTLGPCWRSSGARA